MQLHKGFQQIVRRGFPNYKDCAWRLVMVGFAVQVCMTLGILYRLTCQVKGAVSLDYGLRIMYII